MGEHQKALEQNEPVQMVLNDMGLSFSFLGEEMDGAYAQITLGKSSANPTNIRKLKTPVEILSQISSRSQIQEVLGNLRKYLDIEETNF